MVVMKDFTHKILALFLTFVVLFATASITIERYLCMNKVYSYAFFGHAQDCGMRAKTCNIYNKSTKSFSKKSCCANDIQIKRSFKTVRNRTVHPNKQERTFLTKNLLINLDLAETFKQPLNASIKYTPLLIKNKLSIFYQVFII